MAQLKRRVRSRRQQTEDGVCPCHRCALGLDTHSPTQGSAIGLGAS
jgi:hypothetical protein